MAVTQEIAAKRVPEAFVEALDRHLAGSLDASGVATVLVRSLGRDMEGGLAVKMFLEEARHRDQLPADLVAFLMPVVDAVVTEDVPTHGTGTRTDVNLNPGDTVSTLAPVDPDLGPGSILKQRFELVECLGSGPMGKVFRARDRRRAESATGTDQVVLKLVTANLAGATRALEALRREAEIGQRLTHPAVVRIHDLDRDGPHAFLVMEWLKGESLAKLLDRRQGRPMPRVQALQILEAVCRALGHAHGLGIVHGDIKPGNIFVTEDSGPRLLDFGIARHVRESSKPTGHTPEYASCEILEGREPDPRDDLYAVACVAYRMLAGRRPFGGQTALEAEAAGRIPAPVDILSPSQWRVLEKALSFRREERQPDVISFLAQFKGPRDEQLQALAAGDGAAPGADATPRVAAEPETAGSAPVEPVPATDRLPDGVSPGRPAWLLPAGAVATMLAALGIWALVDGPADPGTAAPPTASTSTPTPAPAVARQTLPVLEDTPMPVIDPPAVMEDGEADRSAPDATARGTRDTKPEAVAALPARVEPSTPPAAPSPPAPPASSPSTVMLAATSPADVLAADRSSRAGTGPALPATPANPSREAAAAAAPAGPGGGATAAAPEASAPVQSPSPSPPAAPVAAASTGLASAGPASTSRPGGSGPDTRGGPAQDTLADEVRMADLEMKRYVEPTYPRLAAQRRLAGWVEVGFSLDGRGRPADLKVLAADPAGVFEEAALEAVERWRFGAPGGRKLQPGTRTRVRVRFQPDD